MSNENSTAKPTAQAIIKYGQSHCANCGGSWPFTDYGSHLACTNPACPNIGKKFRHQMFDLAEIK